MKRFIATAGLLILCAAGCTVARRPNTIPESQLRPDIRLADGQYVFMQHCNQCHVGGAAGLGPSLNDKPLPEWALKLQVRNGYGAMPRFAKHVISDAQLDDLAHYLKYLHDHPDRPLRT